MDTSPMDSMPEGSTLSKYAGEFLDETVEKQFLEFSWHRYKTATQSTLLVIGFMGFAFLIGDILDVGYKNRFYLLFLLRLFVVGSILLSVFYIHRAAEYFKGYHHLLLFNQILIAVGIFLLAVIRQMPIAHIGINTILLTLVYYQFINNRFSFTLIACCFIGSGAVLTGLLFLNMTMTDFIGSILFLLPVNFLGIIILRSIKRSRRTEYLALMASKKSNDEKAKLIQELKDAMAEVKTLRGFIPICAHCHNIRNDKGFWNRIEDYIHEKTGAMFSHSLCPACAEELNPDIIKGNRDK